MEWISPAVFHTLPCIRPWNSHNVPSLLPETEACGPGQAVLSQKEPQRRSPYSPLHRSCCAALAVQTGFWAKRADFTNGNFSENSCQKFEGGKERREGGRGREGEAGKEGQEGGSGRERERQGGRAGQILKGSLQGTQHCRTWAVKLFSIACWSLHIRVIPRYPFNTSLCTCQTWHGRQLAYSQNTPFSFGSSLESKGLQQEDLVHVITWVSLRVSLILGNWPSCGLCRILTGPSQLWHSFSLRVVTVI